MSGSTRFLGRLLGLYCMAVAIVMVFRKDTMLQAITSLVHDQGLMFIVGIITLFAGLAMLLCHNRWSGGAMPVVITLIGWLTLAKGVLFLCLSPNTAPALYLGALHYASLIDVYAALSFGLGAFLAHGGFMRKAPS